MIPSDLRPDPIGPEFVDRGFGAVNKSMETVLGFECSPLSCNYLAVELPTNEFCLFPSRDAAVVVAESFSIEQPERGDYYVIQVLELTEAGAFEVLADFTLHAAEPALHRGVQGLQGPHHPEG